MQISELKQRVDIEYEELLEDGLGGYDSTWKNFATVWAKAVPYKICYSAINKYDKVQNYTFVIRGIDGIEPSMRISFQKKSYKIIRIKQLDKSSDFLEIYTSLRSI
jgi:head-tail adaptor